MTAKSVLLRPQGLRPREPAPTCPSCYATGCMIKTRVAFLQGRLLSSQSEQFKVLKSSDWLEKTGPPKKPLLFCSCKQVIMICTTFEDQNIIKLEILAHEHEMYYFLLKTSGHPIG